MMTQFMYMGVNTPENQFVEILKQKKSKHITSEMNKNSLFYKRDYELKIELIRASNH